MFIAKSAKSYIVKLDSQLTRFTALILKRVLLSIEYGAPEKAISSSLRYYGPKSCPPQRVLIGYYRLSDITELFKVKESIFIWISYANGAKAIMP